MFYAIFFNLLEGKLKVTLKKKVSSIQSLNVLFNVLTIILEIFLSINAVTFINEKANCNLIFNFYVPFFVCSRK